MCSNSEPVGSVRRPLQLPSNPEAWDGVDRADLVDECEGCGLAKGPTIHSSDLVDPSATVEVLEPAEELPEVATDGDPWADQNGLPEYCTCRS